MNRRFLRKVQTLGFVIVLSIAVVTLMVVNAVSLAQSNKARRSTGASESSKGGHVASPPSGNKSLSGVKKDVANSLFLPAASYPTGGNGASWLAVADLNGDGKPDVVVTNTFGGTVGVLLGTGAGSFEPAVTYSLSVDPRSVFIADVNGDHKPDLIVGSGGFAAVFLGNGDGTFQPAVVYGSGGNSYAGNQPQILVADVNRDGKPDLIEANQCDDNSQDCAYGSVGVLLGNGDGTFQPVVTYASGGAVTGGIVLADFNGDGKLDLAISNCAGTVSNCGITHGSVGVLLGNGDGTFQPATVCDAGSAGLFASPLVSADLNRDGKPDLVIANPGGDGGNGEGSAGVLLGNGDGTFQAVATYDSGGDWADSIAVADFNGDGIPDLVLADFSGTVGVLLGKGDGTFGAVESLLAGVANHSVSVLAADVDGDGVQDVVVLTWGPIEVLLGIGDGTFQAEQTFDSGAGPYVGLEPTFAAADLNGDGRLDLMAVANNELGVLLGNPGYGSATRTTLTSSLNPSDFGQTVTFTAAVSSASGAPTGTVIFYDGSTALGSATLANGDASISTSGLGAGSHSITAGYLGSTSFAPSTSPVLTQVVNGVTTTTSLVSSLNPSVFGQSVTFTAGVSSSAGTPTGTVIFYDGSNAIGSATLAGGTAAISTASLAVGSHSITAAYQGSGDFAPSTSAMLNQVVNGKGHFSTKTKLATSGSPSFVGQPVTFTATVTSKDGTIPDGELVTFYDDDKTIGTGTTAGGVASFTSSSLTPKKHTIKATYAGDATFKESSGTLTQVVDKYATTTVLVSSLNPAVYGQPITYTATVTSSGPNPPTGDVKLTGIGLVPLVGGVATVTKPLVRTGTHAITAVYMGDDEFAKSASPVLKEVVNPASTTTALASSANPSSSGQTVTFTAIVTSSTGLDPFGKVTFTAGSATLGTVALKDTIASISTATLPVGSTTITATYSGADGFTGSSASLIQTVEP